MSDMTRVPPFARTPEPPYYVVVFTSQRSGEQAEYEVTADRMMALASEQPGFLGVESCRGTDGFGITVSYWENEAAIAAWRADAEHRAARESGRREWYDGFELRVGLVSRARSWRAEDAVS